MENPISLPDEASLRTTAKRWIHSLQRPAYIYLSGELGAGKSTFVRAALGALGVTGNVKSPTFSLLESYSVGDLVIYHMDLYRLTDAEELEYIGFRDLLADADYLFIEWPDKAHGYLPEPTHRIQIDYDGNGRRLSIMAR